ncbi:hypothetical protein CK203_001410 [Vitis vinifera]|uniref:Uncharacterized protein n=1 Tax=Vitis vinifera TaxID=29760 RepID=A0A438KM98_VITVI|nr:hypothetical protein CK203_001410 [Vitis vinifera]
MFTVGNGGTSGANTMAILRTGRGGTPDVSITTGSEVFHSTVNSIVLCEVGVGSIMVLRVTHLPTQLGEQPCFPLLRNMKHSFLDSVRIPFLEFTVWKLVQNRNFTSYQAQNLMKRHLANGRRMHATVSGPTIKKKKDSSKAATEALSPFAEQKPKLKPLPWLSAMGPFYCKAF